MTEGISLGALLLLQIGAQDPPRPPETGVALEQPVNRIEAFEPLRPPIPSLSEEVDRSYERLRCSTGRLWCASLKQKSQDGPLRRQLCGIERSSHPHVITRCIRHDYMPKHQDVGDPGI